MIGSARAWRPLPGQAGAGKLRPSSCSIPQPKKGPPQPKPLRKSHLRPSQLKYPGLSPVYTKVPAHSPSKAQGNLRAGGNGVARGTPRDPVPRSRPLTCARASKLHFQRWKTFYNNAKGAAHQIKKYEVEEKAQPCYRSKPPNDFYFNNTFFPPPLFQDAPRPIHQCPHTTHFPGEPAHTSPSAAPPGVLSPSRAAGRAQDLAPRDGARSLQRPHPATSARRPAQPSLPTKRDPGDTAEGL